jgi:hypothetical protein
MTYPSRFDKSFSWRGLFPDQPCDGDANSDSSSKDAALVLWLRWNDAFERVNREMYLRRHEPEVLEALMSQLDELREEAVRQTDAVLRADATADVDRR